MNALPSDFKLTASPSSGVVQPGQSISVEFSLRIDIVSCDDIVFFMHITDGAGALLVIKVKSWPGAQAEAWRQNFTPNEPRPEDDTLPALMDQDVREDMSKLLLMDD
eukprot:c19817_g1_i1.p1 GENE.c19817_g1_i1~~c19817_g1_i1.p1  ORF type:complete len:107 (-),score=21.84 c19817_g1_i1:161-481(-)